MQRLLTRYQISLPQIALALVFNAVLFIEIVVTIFCAILKIQQSPYLSFLFPFALAIPLTLWVQYDGKSVLGMDQGMYILFGWPVMFPIYVLKSRGFRSGGSLLLGFFGLLIFTLISIVITTITVGILITLLGLYP